MPRTKYTTVRLRKLLKDDGVQCSDCTELITGPETLVVKANTRFGRKCRGKSQYYHIKSLRPADTGGNLLDTLRFMPSLPPLMATNP